MFENISMYKNYIVYIKILIFNSLGVCEGRYKERLCIIKEMISMDDGPHDEKVVHELGIGFSGLYSVPTAIFCFLRAQKPIVGISTDNPFRRAIQYAVSYNINIFLD